jgi:hypothetical protein
MADSTISVSFSASIGDLISGISQARDAVATLGTPAQQLSAQYSQLRDQMSSAFDSSPLKAYSASLSEASEATKVASDAEAAAVKEGIDRQMAAVSEQVRMHQIASDANVGFTRAALDQEYANELSHVQAEEQLGTISLGQKAHLLAQELEADRSYLGQEAVLTQQSLEAQYRDYEALGSKISAAFNGQLKGLLSGTETWRKAFSNTLETLTIDFIEWNEKTLVQYLAGEATKTAATTAGVEARTGAEQAGATASLAAQGETMIRSILSSAAEAFAGVFGFLSPVMGPAAAGPAAGAYGAVAAMAGSVPSADIGMWQVPHDMLTLVHHNELIMPSQEAGAFRRMLSQDSGGSNGSVHIAPTTHFHVSAIDSGSVAQWMRSNSSSMMKAIDEAVRHGAALGTKRLRI